MKRSRFIVTAISAAAAGGALVTDACSPFGVPPAGRSLPGSSTAGALDALASGRRVHTLTVGYATTTIAGYRLRTRTYNGATHGPTIETRPGETLSFRIVNRLPPNRKETLALAGTPIPLVTDMMEAMNPELCTRTIPSGKIDVDNNPHGFNTTNLHVHGIQTFPHLFSPVGTSDPRAMMIEIEPGQDFQYDFTVPHDHPSGLYWYHPHKHGSTDVQVSGGMAGLIVMRGPIDDVPEIAAAREIFMVVQSLEINRSRRSPTRLYEREYVAYRPPAQGGYKGFTNFTLLTVNGSGVCWVDNRPKKNTYVQLEVPEFDLAPGEVVRLRLLNGTNVRTLLLALEAFDVWQIGFDGVNLLAPAFKDMSGAGVTTIDTQNYRKLPIQVAAPANRIELLLRAPAQPGSYALRSLPSATISGVGKTPKIYDLARFVVRGTPVRMRIPKKLPVPVREYPLITEADIVARRTFKFDITFPSNVLLTGVIFTVNGELYKMLECPTRVRVGTCEEWRIENADPLEPHPFHLHTNSFQLIAIDDEPVEPVEIWDTFPVPPRASAKGKNGSITVRIRFKEWVGKDVFHCHVLNHEDTGMMQNFLIV